MQQTFAGGTVHYDPRLKTRTRAGTAAAATREHLGVTLALGQPRIEYKSSSEPEDARSGLVLAEALDGAVAMAPGRHHRSVDKVPQGAERHGAILGYHGSGEHLRSVNHGLYGFRGLRAEGRRRAEDRRRRHRGRLALGLRAPCSWARTLTRPTSGNDAPSSRGPTSPPQARFIGQIGTAIDDYVTSQPGDELGILRTTRVRHRFRMHMALDVLPSSGHRASD
ncbi:hypothetical protein [Glutamicibacter arilaitensis]|uniref:hypothetical protein n=1 Tax=Glutamicibacter arilaitensis TaxID=256701 RepID=UPI003A90B505